MFLGMFFREFLSADTPGSVPECSAWERKGPLSMYKDIPKPKYHAETL